MTSASDGRRLLRQYHATPGRTVAMLQGWNDDVGRTTYEALAARMDTLARSVGVLDIGCGDGFLLQMLAQRGFTHLTGVDVSREELDAAGERLSSTARLLCHDAQTIALPEHSFDVALCHMALMIMPSVESVLAEIARLLRPGGRFIAVINRALRDPVYEVYRRALYRMTADSGMKPLRLAAPRVFTVAGLTELFHSQSFVDMDIEDFRIRIHDSPDAVWSRLHLMYDVYRLPASAQSAMERQVLDGWRPLCNDSGQIACSLGMRIIDCQSASRRS